MSQPLVAIVMGSKSDWEVMSRTCATLDRFGITHEKRVLSAHRTPDQAADFFKSARSRGVEIIIAAAGGAAHLAGVAAAFTTIPVLAVPMQTKSLGGLDSLLSMVQMPGGIPVATFAIGTAGATNAALFAVSILANKYPEYTAKLEQFRAEQTANVLAETLD